MSDKIDFDEWEQNNDGLDWEDQRQDFYDQLQGWVQKNAEVTKIARGNRCGDSSASNLCDLKGN